MTTFMGAFHRWSGFRVWQDVNGDGVSQPTGVAGDVWLVYDPIDTGAVAPAGTISAAPADGTMPGGPTIAGTLTGHFGGPIFNAGSSAFIAPASAGVAIAGAAPILSIADTAAPQPQGHLVFAGGGGDDVSLVYNPTDTGTVVPAGTISAAPAHGTMSGVLTIAGTLTGHFDGPIFNAGPSAFIAPAFAGVTVTSVVQILSVAGTVAQQQQGHLVFAGSDVSLVYDPTVTGTVAPAGTISAAPADGTMSVVLTIAGTLTGQASGTITSAAASAVILSVADTAVSQPQGHPVLAGS